MTEEHELREEIAGLRKAQVAEAIQQVRYGPDGARQVPGWQRLNAYWWLKSGWGATESVTCEGMDRASTWPTFLRELYARLYTGDRCREVEPRAEFAFSSKLHSLLSELPEWERLTRRCRGDGFSAGSAATGLASQLVEHVPTHVQDARAARRQHDLEAEEWMEALRRDPDAVPPESLELARQALEQAEAEAQTQAGAMDASALRQAMREGIKAQANELDAMDRAAAALGWGSQQAGQGEETMLGTKAAIARKLRDMPKLQEIVDLAGRMKNVMREVQATKVRHGVNEVTDIEVGRDFQRLLPSELAALSRPLMKLDLMRRLAEGNALQYRLEAEEKVGRGPIVVAIDDSGSMNGKPEVWSKAVALALLELARREKRPFAYCLFTRKVDSAFVERPGVVTPPEELLAQLSIHNGGGTAFDPPLEWALEQIAETPTLVEADIVFVTDGCCRASEETIRKVKSADCHCWGVEIGQAVSSMEGRGIASFCERVWPVRDLAVTQDNDEANAAARGVLAI